MTDAHCHLVRGETRHFVCGDGAIGPVDVRFCGLHPWEFLAARELPDFGAIERRLADDSHLGVGEIGLDRLKVRDIPQTMRDAFEAQLALAAKWRRPVVLHGAKCWGQVVKACVPYAGKIPSFLFHGFSRSDGLLPDIVKMDGFISIGPAILNDHAVNYRKLAAKIPADHLLVESDATLENDGETPHVNEIFAKLAEIRGVTAEDIAQRIEANADRFVESLK